LDCNHPDDEGYVELTQVEEVKFNDSDGVFDYQIELPKYDSPVTYYVVASAEGYIPETGTAVVSVGDTDVTVDPLILLLSPAQ
jgi:hypothetical protein